MYGLPFIIGISLHTPSPPTEVNCPSDVSRKKSGIPANTRVIKYGIRKAPEEQAKQILIYSLLVIFTAIKKLSFLYITVQKPEKLKIALVGITD